MFRRYRNSSNSSRVQQQEQQRKQREQRQQKVEEEQEDVHHPQQQQQQLQQELQRLRLKRHPEDNPIIHSRSRSAASEPSSVPRPVRPPVTSSSPSSRREVSSSPLSIFPRRKSSQSNNALTSFASSSSSSANAPLQRDYKYEVLHPGSLPESRNDGLNRSQIYHGNQNGNQNGNGNGNGNESDDLLSPMTSAAFGSSNNYSNYDNDGVALDDQHSIALSESDTLIVTRNDRRELQPSYTDNFTLYYPYVIRRMLLAQIGERHHQRNVEGESRSVSASGLGSGSRAGPEEQHTHRTFTNGEEVSEQDREVVEHEYYEYNADGVDDGDLSTIINDDQAPVEYTAIEGAKIMRKGLVDFDYKRELVIMTGMLLKHTTYIFPTVKSFELFKELRLKVKQERKNSIILYDPKNGGIRRASSSTSVDKIKKEFAIPEGSEEIVDERNHIVPMDYKIKGLGLPLFKMFVPYMSTFRRNSPFIIFKRYKEVPSSPVSCSSSSGSSPDDTSFETYDFCYVQSRYFQNYRRFIYEFLPNTPDAFKVVSIQSNFCPFTDFVYKETRFRILGTTISTGLMCQYIPHMKLVVIDDDQDSLCDELYNKPPSSATSFLHLKKDSHAELPQFNFNDPSTFINPVPSKQNKLAYRLSTSLTPIDLKHGLIPIELPPFGSFKDSSLYLPNTTFGIPKKYNDLGRVEVYQNLNATLPSSSSLNAGPVTPLVSSSETDQGIFPMTSASSHANTANEANNTNGTISGNDNNPFRSEYAKDVNSTLSVDMDTMVLTVILSTMREVNVRNAGKSSSNTGIIGGHAASMARVGGFGMGGAGPLNLM